MGRPASPPSSIFWVSVLSLSWPLKMMTWGYIDMWPLEWFLDGTYHLCEHLIILKSMICNVCFVTQWKDHGLQGWTDGCYSPSLEELHDLKLSSRDSDVQRLRLQHETASLLPAQVFFCGSNPQEFFCPPRWWDFCRPPSSAGAWGEQPGGSFEPSAGSRSCLTDRLLILERGSVLWNHWGPSTLCASEQSY